MNKELILSEIKSLNERVDARPYYGIYAHGMSIDNPLAWMWGDDKTLVNEGLVKTYPIEACKKHMMNFFGFLITILLFITMLMVHVAQH